MPVEEGFERLQGDQNQVKNEWILGGPSAKMWRRMLAEVDNLPGMVPGGWPGQSSRPESIG